MKHSLNNIAGLEGGGRGAGGAVVESAQIIFEA